MLIRYKFHIFFIVIILLFFVLWYIVSERNTENNNICPAESFKSFTSQSSRKKFISKGERICCETLEKVYKVPFKSEWPEWLVNPETGKRMQLDCYNDQIKIALEYNGIQHYHWPNFTKQSYKDFINQIRRDELKTRLCKLYGVHLIVVPYTVPYEKIPDYILSKLPDK